MKTTTKAKRPKSTAKAKPIAKPKKSKPAHAVKASTAVKSASASKQSVGSWIDDWRALMSAPDPARAFVTHFAPLAVHPDSVALLGELAGCVEGFSIEHETEFRLDTRCKLGGEVLVVHFKPPRSAAKDGPTTWTCAPPGPRLA